MNKINKILDLAVTVILWSAGAIMVFVLAQVLLFASFKIPTDSMQPTIMPGDNILVVKPLLGARLFNVSATLNGEAVEIKRLPGISSFSRNDVLVFNNPIARNWDKIEFDVMKYFVKRCIAIPGDTLTIENGFYRVKGVTDTLGNLAAQLSLHQLPKNSIEKGLLNSLNGWTILDFGPLYVPRKDDEITISKANVQAYKRLIEYETGKEISERDGLVYLDNNEFHSYKVQQNYYFMGGDNVLNSQDSRYWGPLPESFIVGKAIWIWKSEDKQTGAMNWSRFFKRIS